MHCVDLGESFLTSIYLKNLASIQPRTSRFKFADTNHPPRPGQLLLRTCSSGTSALSLQRWPATGPCSGCAAGSPAGGSLLCIDAEYIEKTFCFPAVLEIYKIIQLNLIRDRFHNEFQVTRRNAYKVCTVRRGWSRSARFLQIGTNLRVWTYAFDRFVFCTEKYGSLHKEK